MTHFARRGEPAHDESWLMLRHLRWTFECSGRPEVLKVALSVPIWRRGKLAAQIESLSDGLADDSYRLASAAIDQGPWLRRRATPAPPWDTSRAKTSSPDKPNRNSFGFLIYERCEHEQPR
jgi:hypothetical protein